MALPLRAIPCYLISFLQSGMASERARTERRETYSLDEWYIFTLLRIQAKPIRFCDYFSLLTSGSYFSRSERSVSHKGCANTGHVSHLQVIFLIPIYTLII